MFTKANGLTLPAALLLSFLGTLNAANVAIAQPATPSLFINILTAGTGGVFYPLGGALSNILAAKVPGTKPSVQATKGSVDNLNLLQQRKGEIAFTQGDVLVFAWEGDAAAGFKSKVGEVRGIAAIYPSYIQIVAMKESGIRTFTDLKGRRLSVGAKRSGNELTTRLFFKAAGMTYKDLGKIAYLPFEESVDLMKNRQLDATVVTAGLGTPALREIANTFAVTFVEIPSGIVSKAGAPYTKTFVPKDTYRGQDADVQTAGLPNYLVARADLPTDFVYNMTKAIFDSTAELVAAHPAAAEIKLERALDGMPIPLHPGAAKYYKEKSLIR
jgi:TRAP transporter TAXI family solute receptor